MKDRKLFSDALDHVEPALVRDAAHAKRKPRVLKWIATAAAVLALVIFLQYVNIPMFLTARAVSTASDPRITSRPSRIMPGFDEKFDQWRQEREVRSSTASAALATMDGFLADSCKQFLTGAQGNQLYSPINAYLGLAMLAECTGGTSRQQILTALGVSDTGILRTQVSALWESVYNREQNQITTLANSLWLDSSLQVNQETADVLAYHYYASVYQRSLSAPGTSRDIGAWLNNNTGGMLKNVTGSYQLPPETVLALFSTIYFQGRWSDEFNPANNTAKKFHAPGGDMTATFMNARLREMNYYWGADFGAVRLSLKNGASMWFFLPDEDKTVDDVLSAGEYLQTVLHDDAVKGQNKYMKVNLSIPKFDVSSTTDLKDGLKAMGITHVFDFDTSDFSSITDEPVAVSAANQSVRVCIDEEGVKAAAYIEIPGAGAAAPPEEIIDFILDRPFLFVITSSAIPLFAGVVNCP